MVHLVHLVQTRLHPELYLIFTHNEKRIRVFFCSVLKTILVYIVPFATPLLMRSIKQMYWLMWRQMVLSLCTQGRACED